MRRLSWSVILMSLFSQRRNAALMVCIFSVVGMIFGQDRDQLLRRAVPQVTGRQLLRVALLSRWWRRITCAVVDVEAVDSRVM